MKILRCFCCGCWIERPLLVDVECRCRRCNMAMLPCEYPKRELLKKNGWKISRFEEDIADKIGGKEA